MDCAFWTDPSPTHHYEDKRQLSASFSFVLVSAFSDSTNSYKAPLYWHLKQQNEVGPMPPSSCMRELRLRELKFFSQGHTQNIRRRIHSLPSPSLLSPRSILKVPFHILKQREKGWQGIGKWEGVKDSLRQLELHLVSCSIRKARHGSTEEGRNQGQQAFGFTLARCLSPSLVARYQLVWNHSSSLLSWEAKGVLLSQFFFFF